MLILLSQPSRGADCAVKSGTNNTMLMFVGEDLQVLTIASRRQESAFKAPAIARVITRKMIRERGINTLAQALEMMPGFYMAKKEWGTAPYLRGISDSILFLYDTVPLGSEITKSVHPLDHELSLEAVKRIEIVQGPGSVLWGPDAFAGIVNVVPLTGKDLTGVETGIIYDLPKDQKGFYTNFGYDAGLWDAFLSVSARSGYENDGRYNLVSFWGSGSRPVAPENRFGSEELGRTRILEISGNFSHMDWLSVSGRICDFKRPYILTREEGDISWRESRSFPQGFLKLELKKDISPSSAVRFAGYYSKTDIEYEVIDFSLDQEEESFYTEIIYDKTIMSGRGLFTGGLSYRKKHVKDVPVWNSYLPDDLGPDNEVFLPSVEEESYNTDLNSFFAQYTHKFGEFDFIAGARHDNYDDYPDHMSCNLGVTWSFNPAWILKVLYGTAYRTPFARQLQDDDDIDLEEIESLNAQIAWQPSQRVGLTISGFISEIKNHIKEDPYAGLSRPGRQKIKGLEIEGRLSPLPSLLFAANVTFVHTDGRDEIYHYNDYTIIEPYEIIEKHYIDISCPYDKGPGTMFNITGTWKPLESITAFVRVGYFSERKLAYPVRADSINTGESGYSSFSGITLVDASLTFKNFLFDGFELVVAARNIFDKDYETPGTYTAISGDPFETTFVLRKRW